MGSGGESMFSSATVRSRAEISEKKFKLTPGLYAGGKVEEDDGEPFPAKMKRLTGELGELFGESARLEKFIRNTYFKKIQAPLGATPRLVTWMELA